MAHHDIWHRLSGALLLGIGAFQASVAAGAPWGRACYGGGHPGVLPGRLRATSAGAASAYAGLAFLIVRLPLGDRRQRRLSGVLAGVFSGACVLNALSPSRLETAIWAPISALLAASLWAGRPPAP